MRVEIIHGIRVTMHFSLMLEDQTIIDSTFDKEPANFCVGDGNLLPGFEKVLIGLAIGEEEIFEIEPQEAFGQYNDQKFWQMTTDSLFTIEYDRDEMKPLKHQWNKMLGPISLSGVDLFNIQYECINGNVTSVSDFETTY